MIHKKTIGLIGLCSAIALSHVEKKTFSPFFTTTVNKVKAYGYYIPQANAQLIKQDGKKYFEASYRLLPDVLEKARREQCPFILMIPEKLDGFTPVNFESPLIEGARIALTWSSAYFRFKELGNVDVRILLIPDTHSENPHTITDYITQAMSCVMHTRTNKSSEEQMADRMFQARSLTAIKAQNSVTVEPYFTEPRASECTIITPSLANDTQKKRAVITGAAGFLGSYLSQELLKRNYQIIALDNLNCCTGENIKELQTNQHFSFHQYDVSYPFDIAGHVDVVIHFASVPSPAQYYAMPVETLRSGLHGTKETLELALRKKAKFLFASTSEVYGDPKEHPQTEQYPGNVSPIGKRSQYDESKRGAETLIKLYFEEHGLDVRIARIFNTFGPGMQLSDGRVITNFIQAALNNTPMIIHGNGTQTRSPAYVSDTIEGVIRILESEKISTFPTIKQRIFNVGTQEEYSINEIAKFINQLAQKYLHRTVPTTYIAHFDQTDPQVRQPDITYLRKTTQFNIQVPFHQGLEETFLHYYHQFNRMSAHEKE